MDESKMTALESIVAGVDAAGGPTPEQAQEQQAAAALADEAQQWGMIPFMVGGALSVLVPKLKQVYTEEACLAWGSAMAPVSQKYGWGGPGAIPEIGLVIATGALAIPTFMLVRAELAKLEEKDAAEAAKPANAGPLGDVGVAPVGVADGK